jgi:purine nucleosidase
MPLRMVGWDISRNYAWIGPEEKAEIRALDSELAHFTLDIQSTLEKFAVDVSKLPGFDLPDPIAMAIALDPSLIEDSEELFVEIVKSEGATRGQTLVDHTGAKQQQANTQVVLEASRKKFLHKLYQSLI